jgi:2-haloalkanoic acid dehalogenase type II
VRPRLFTFDIFGTVLDWRRGLREAVATTGAVMDDATFDRIIDAQAALESGPFRRYAEIVAESLVQVLGMDRAAATAIGRGAGEWPLFPDSADALRRLRRIAPCAATTNSDSSHGRSVQRSLGFDLDEWICAEEIRAYKPDPRVWREAVKRTGIEPGPSWWHVSAYADYDLATARSLGLTCVFVNRPHARPGPSDLSVADLHELADVVEIPTGRIPTGR